MAFLTKHGIITVKPFTALPEIPEVGLKVIRPPASAEEDSLASGVSASRGPLSPLSECCFVTRTVKYSNEVVYWVSPVRDPEKDSGDKLDVLNDLAISGSVLNSLDDESNLSFLDPYIHTLLDVYGAIAVTPDVQTLDSLIDTVRQNNENRQEAINISGRDLRREITHPQAFRKPMFELVALYPGHFLPRGSQLSVYDQQSDVTKTYVASSDFRVRETRDPQSLPLPPFAAPDRTFGLGVNPYLVALNAEIKFRRYVRIPARMRASLPEEVFTLINKTIELVRLIYWKPSAPPIGTRAYDIYEGDRISSRRNIDRELRHGSPPRSHKFAWIWELDDEEREETLSAMMAGHDKDYDPALLEGGFPLGWTPGVYEQNDDIMNWVGGLPGSSQRENPGE